MQTSSSFLVERPVPGRVPPLPVDEVPEFLFSVLPASIPIRLVERLLGTSVRIDNALYQEMLDGLWEGDEPMDRVVEWMFASGPRQSKQMFEQALESGIETVPDAPAPLRDFFARVDTRPEWVDMGMVNKGALAVNAMGDTLHYIARDVALMGGYLLSGLNQPLVMTGALSKGTGRRFAETMSWATDIYAPKSMERFGQGFKSTIRVRMIHALVRRNLQKNPEWDFERHALPINQTDMLGTILATVVIALGARALGVPVSRKEESWVLHHGRYVAWLIGVKEEWGFTTSGEAVQLLLHSASTQPRGEETSRIMAQSLAAEPLSRRYSNLQALRRRYEYAKHLSISRLFLRKDTLEQLGVSSRIPPWYPAVTIPVRFTWQMTNRLLPGGYQRLCREGREKQLAMLKVFHEGAESAAGLIQPDEAHPAHV